jgi:hypothetical protein
MTPRSEVLERSRLEGESVLWPKDRGSTRLSVQDPPTVLLTKPVDEAHLLELGPRFEREGAPKGVTKPDVGEIGTVELDSERHVIERDPEATLFSRHFGCQQVHSESHFSQQPRERRVELVAETPAPRFHDLVKNPILIEHDRHAPANVQILERDFEKMLLVHPGQPREIVPPLIGKAEPPEVALSIHRLSCRGIIPASTTTCRIPPSDRRLAGSSPATACFDGRQLLTNSSQSNHLL